MDAKQRLIDIERIEEAITTDHAAAVLDDIRAGAQKEYAKARNIELLHDHMIEHPPGLVADALLRLRVDNLARIIEALVTSGHLSICDVWRMEYSSYDDIDVLTNGDMVQLNISEAVK